MKISKQGLDFIKGFEGTVLYVYDDLRPSKNGKYAEWDGGAVRGTLTIGTGHTDAAKHPLKIKQGLRITQEQADRILAVDLEECEQDVLRLVKKPLTQGQFDACVSFVYNCGAGNFKSIAARINRGDYRGARAAFDLYVKSKGQTLRGLQRRRDGEQVLWDSDIPNVPTEPVDHPAEVDQPQKPTVKDLVKVSRKARWMVWTQRGVDFVLGLLTIDTVLSAMDVAQDVVGKVKGFVSEGANVLAISAAILAALALRYVISLMREDNEGRELGGDETEAETA